MIVTSKTKYEASGTEPVKYTAYEVAREKENIEPRAERTLY